MIQRIIFRLTRAEMKGKPLRLKIVAVITVG